MTQRKLIDYDDIDGWEQGLTDELTQLLPISFAEDIARLNPQYVEDARSYLLKAANRNEVIERTLSWLERNDIKAYHGTRLDQQDLDDVRKNGLIPLVAEDREPRLRRALSKHPRWSDAVARLTESIVAHGLGEKAGNRLGQLHLTISRSGLENGFNHYITHGSEFDQRVAQHLLGDSGVDLLRADGIPVIVEVAIPGEQALRAAHPHFTVEDIKKMGEIPNIASEFLGAWAYRKAHPAFSPTALQTDCGLVLREALTGDKIIQVQPLLDP